MTFSASCMFPSRCAVPPTESCTALTSAFTSSASSANLYKNCYKRICSRRVWRVCVAVKQRCLKCCESITKVRCRFFVIGSGILGAGSNVFARRGGDMSPASAPVYKACATFFFIGENFFVICSNKVCLQRPGFACSHKKTFDGVRNGTGTFAATFDATFDAPFDATFDRTSNPTIRCNICRKSRWRNR